MSAKRLLLIVDNADSDVATLIGTLLEHTHISVLMTAAEPWHRDLSGFKVMDLQLDKLDALSSAKLFLRRVRRSLHNGDFEEFGQVGDPLSPGALGTSDWNAHVQALLQHPLLQLLDGHPGKIRRAAERVTGSLASLYDLRHELMARCAEV